MGKRNRRFADSALDNNATFRQYFDRLVSLSISMFDWQGLPDTIDVRFLELTLFSQGQAVFFKDDDIGFLALRCVANGPFDLYQIPINRRAIASNGYQKDLDRSDSVIIWNNLLHTNSELDVRMFAKRLYNIDRAIDVNVNAQKTPILIRCAPEQELTLKNLYMQYDGNAPVIYANNAALNDHPLEAIHTEAPYMADRLYQLRTQIWNEALTYLGISNVNTQKKERLITDEAIRQMGGVIANRYARLEARRQAADAINRMFGTNITVDFRADFREADDEWMLPDDTVTDSGESPTAIVTDLRSDTPVPKGGEG